LFPSSEMIQNTSTYAVECVIFVSNIDHVMLIMPEYSNDEEDEGRDEKDSEKVFPTIRS
jgi:hypothetical protein